MKLSSLLYNVFDTVLSPVAHPFALKIISKFLVQIKYAYPIEFVKFPSGTVTVEEAL